MKKVENKEKYLQLFSEYKHNIPVIYSSLEGQYDGELFVDSENNPQIAVLFTPFAFHFVAGNPETNDVVNLLDELIFRQYLSQTGQKEAIVFCPDVKWDKVLDEVFKKRCGIKDCRKIYHLNRDKFAQVQARKKTFENYENKIFYEQNGGAKKTYPVSRIFNGTKCVSFCSGFMLGQGHAEIDVGTEEAYRRKGYAKEAAITLIVELLKNGIEPNWCTWPYRIESQNLALSLGYELAGEIPAHIWVEAECGEI